MRLAACLLVLLAACSIGRKDKERLGDEAWHDGRWSDALAAYKSAGDYPRLLAKRADAALLAGELVEAAQSWTKLGTDDRDRAGEAGAGLARTAYAAERAGDQNALGLSLLGLRKVAPGWPLGRLAMRLGRMGGMSGTDAAEVIPAALAAVSGRATADPLLLAMGHAERMSGACDRAVPVLEGVIRRGSAELRDSAATDLGWCELHLGLAALGNARPGEAEHWLDRAGTRDPIGAVGRRALIGLGDARIKQGDTLSAVLAYQRVIAAPVAPDSLTQLAFVRLHDLEPKPTRPDSAAPGRP